jgi:hypothetical protein
MCQSKLTQQIRHRTPVRTPVRLAGCGRRQSGARRSPFRGTRASPAPGATRHSTPRPCPQPPVARVARPCDHGPSCLSCVTTAVSRTQQLVGQLRLVGRSVPMDGQPAIPDDVARALPLHRQNPRPRLRTLCANPRSDVLHRRPALGVYPPMRRHPQIPLSPQLAIDGSLAHSAVPKDEAIGLQGVQNVHRGHADTVVSRRKRSLGACQQIPRSRARLLVLVNGRGNVRGKP